MKTDIKNKERSYENLKLQLVEKARAEKSLVDKIKLQEQIIEKQTTLQRKNPIIQTKEQVIKPVADTTSYKSVRGFQEHIDQKPVIIYNYVQKYHN